MAAFTKIRKLRTGKGGFGGQTAGLEDIYLVRVDTQIDKFQFLELWVANGTLPIPKATFKQFGSSYVVCDYVDADNNGQRYLWTAIVRWKEISESDGSDQTRPTPTLPSAGSGGPPSSDPDDWDPKVTRRPVTVQEPAERLFYESGLNNSLGAEYTAKTVAGERSQFTNSAGIPFRDRLPPHQRIQSLWTIRWMKKTVPALLIEAELHLNDVDVTFDYRGYSETWVAKTAKIESVQLTETKWGNTNAWEIVLEILVDKDGHYINALDEGMTEGYFPGETMSIGGESVVVTEKELLTIKDASGDPILEPVLLDATGKKLVSTGEPHYIKWRDFPLIDFGGLPLLEDMVS